MRKNIILMNAIAFLQGMVFYAAVATLYRQRAGVSLSEMAVIEAVSLGLSLVLEVPWGVAADRLGYRRSMIVCCGLYAVSKVVFWRADGFGGFMAERILLAVVTAGLSGVDESMLVLSCKEEDRQRVFGLYGALGNAGVLLASLVFALFIGEDYRLAALLTVIAYAAAAVLSLFLTEVKPPRREARPLFAPLRVKGLLPLVLAGGLFFEAVSYVSTFLSQLQYLRCGLNDAAIGLCYTAATALSLLGPLSDPLTRRLGRKRTGTLLMLSAAICCMLLAASRSAVVSIAALMLLEAACALYAPLHGMLENALIRTPDRATALSMNALLSSGIGMGANLALGATAEGSLPLGLMLCAGLCFVGMMLFRRNAAQPSAFPE